MGIVCFVNNIFVDYICSLYNSLNTVYVTVLATCYCRSTSGWTGRDIVVFRPAQPGGPARAGPKNAYDVRERHFWEGEEKRCSE